LVQKTVTYLKSWTPSRPWQPVFLAGVVSWRDMISKLEAKRIREDKKEEKG
jgi:hypothetical protein